MQQITDSLLARYKKRNGGKIDDPTLASMANVVTNRNRNLPWVDRALNPGSYPVSNQKQFMDGNKPMSHRLSYSTGENGEAFVQPEIDYKEGQLAWDNKQEPIRFKSKSFAEYYSKNGLIKHKNGGKLKYGGDDWTGTDMNLSPEDQSLTGIDAIDYNPTGKRNMVEYKNSFDGSEGFGDALSVDGTEGSGLSDKQGTNLLSGVVTVGTGAIMAANKKNNNPNSNYTRAGYYQTQTAAKGAGTGASIGSALGPIGTIAGAAVGGIAGYFVGKGQDKKAQKAFQQENGEFMKMRRLEMEGRQPEELRSLNQYYRKGGKLPVTVSDAGTARGTGTSLSFDNGKQATGKTLGNFEVDPKVEIEALRKKGYKGKTTAELFQAKRTRDSLVNVVDNIDSRKSDLVRNALPLPENASQMIAKMTGDARLSTNSLNEDEKLTMYDMLQKAKQRTGQNRGGTQYQDYANKNNTGKDFDNWFNKGKNSVGDIVRNSGSKQNTAYTMASTVGRGNYFTDPETGNLLYTDVYDWNPTQEKNFKGDNHYQKIRNAFRDKEDKNLTKEKNDKFRIGFKFNPQEMEELRKKKAVDKVSDSQLGSRMLEQGFMRNGGSIEAPSIRPKKTEIKPVGYAKGPVKDETLSYLGDLALQTTLDQFGANPFRKGKLVNLSRTASEWRDGRVGVNTTNTILEFAKLATPVLGDLAVNVLQDGISTYDPKIGNRAFKTQTQTGPIIETTGVKKSLKKLVTGGSLLDNFKRTSASTVEVEGPSHEAGGVPVPGMNAEVEGGETLAGDYVFSKELGFAQLHKPIARMKGKIEKKPATRERMNTLKLLNQKENQLKMSQEYTKHKLNLQ